MLFQLIFVYQLGYYLNYICIYAVLLIASTFFYKLQDMREIITIQLGQCGNNIGYQFLQSITQEHSINSQRKYVGTDDYERQRIDVFFNESMGSLYNFRSILVDSEAGVIDNIRGKKLGGLYNCDNFIVGMGSAGNNWAQGYYGKGAESIEYILDSIRNQAQKCDSLQGFQVIHSTGGGTGSGVGSLVLQKIRREYFSQIIQTFTVLPSQKTSTNVVQPYNTIHTLRRLLEQANLSHLLSNEAMQKICQKKQKIALPSHENINTLVVTAMSGISSGFRFPGQVNSGLRKMALNLVPFPRLHFFMNSISPFRSYTVDRTRKCSQKQTIIELFDPLNNLSGVDPKQGRYMTASVVLRGKISTYAAESYVEQIKDKNASYFVDWVEDNISTSYCNVPFSDYEVSGVLVSNNSAISNVYKKIAENYTALFRRKAYLHWYTGQGMDEMEFVQAESSFNDMISEYNWEGCDCCAEEAEGYVE